MKVAIDVSPLQTGHKVRGVGFYLSYLKRALVEYFPENEYVFFLHGDTLDKSIDIVHYPYFDPFFLSVPPIKRHKTIVTVHDLTPLVFPEHFPAGIQGSLRWQFQRINLRRVDGIITDSASSKKDIQRIIKFPEDKISVTYLAAGEEFIKLKSNDLRLKKIRSKYNLPDEFILYVGDVTWNKNLPRLLQAVSTLDVPLVLVGKALASTDFNRKNKWNADLVEVQRIAEKNANILRLGFVSTEELVELYNLATVFVYPSIYEGFGLPILEAMQSGCPVIISHEGCMPEVGGDAAAYFEGYNTESLKLIIQKVLHSQRLQKELSEKGREQAKKFSWKKTAEKTIEAYQRVL